MSSPIVETGAMGVVVAGAAATMFWPSTLQGWVAVAAGTGAIFFYLVRGLHMWADRKKDEQDES